MGWDKALQPQFGLPGLVQPNQNWFVDFELAFFKAGTNQKQKLSKIALTALDVDGDGNSISEYVTYNNPDSVKYSTVSYLNGTEVGAVGQTFNCGECGKPGELYTCSNCKGTGINSNNECGNCKGSGKLHKGCSHAYTGPSGSSVNGPVENFMNIDTLSTQVMATYQYLNKDLIKFRYGAKSGAKSSNGSGIRLNSTWFRSFSLTPPMALAVQLKSFTAMLENGSVTINWTAEQDVNFSHFVVERSTDGVEYAAIASVLSSTVSRYAYRDGGVSSASSMLYYRLRMVDNTKETSLSQVRVIRLGKGAEALTLSTYPNPAVNQVRVSVPSEWQNKAVSIELYSASGIRVQSQQIASARGTEVVEISKATRGMYFIKASCEGKSAQQRIVKN